MEDANDVDIDNDFDDDDTWREQALGALEDGGRGLRTRRGESQAIPQAGSELSECSKETIDVEKSRWSQAILPAGSELVWLGLGFWKKKIKKKKLENCQNVRELVKHQNVLLIVEHSGVTSLIKKKVEDSNGQKTWTPTTAHASRDLGEVRT